VSNGAEQNKRIILLFNRKKMKTIQRNIKLKSMVWAALIGLLLPTWGCQDPNEDLQLGRLPQPDFIVNSTAGSNQVQLINTTSTPGIAYWHIPRTGQNFQGDTVQVHFIFEGDYDVQLMVAGQGGTNAILKKVNVSQSDPNACNPNNPLGFIAGCTTKTWKLNPQAGAFKVGPGAGNGDWWSSGAGDVTGRSCEFNDEYTFSFDANGSFAYDNKGDFYADGYLGTQSQGCEVASNLTGDQALWNSGNFQYAVVATGGVRNLGQLRLIGKGAHIGVKKAHNGGETPTGPVGESITYDILAMEQNVNGQGYDLLTIGVHIGGEGWWSFTLRSSSE
jgi:hypothetical protein